MPEQFDKIKEIINSLSTVYKDRADNIQGYFLTNDSIALSNDCNAISNKLAQFSEKYGNAGFSEDKNQSLSEIYKDIKTLIRKDGLVRQDNPDEIRTNTAGYKRTVQNKIEASNYDEEYAYMNNSAQTMDLIADLYDNPVFNQMKYMAEKQRTQADILDEIKTNLNTVAEQYSRLTTLKDSFNSFYSAKIPTYDPTIEQINTELTVITKDKEPEAYDARIKQLDKLNKSKESAQNELNAYNESIENAEKMLSQYRALSRKITELQTSGHEITPEELAAVSNDLKAISTADKKLFNCSVSELLNNKQRSKREKDEVLDSASRGDDFGLDDRNVAANYKIAKVAYADANEKISSAMVFLGTNGIAAILEDMSKPAEKKAEEIKEEKAEVKEVKEEQPAIQEKTEEQPEIREKTEEELSPAQQALTELKSHLSELAFQYERHAGALAESDPGNERIDFDAAVINKYQGLINDIDDAIEFYSENELTFENCAKLSEISRYYETYTKQDELAGNGKYDELENKLKETNKAIKDLSEKKIERGDREKAQLLSAEKAILEGHKEIDLSNLAGKLNRLANEAVKKEETRKKIEELSREINADKETLSNAEKAFNDKAAADKAYNAAIDGMGEAGKWWRNVQEELNKAGFDLDLRSPEDLGRLVIVDTTIPDGITVEAKARLALDPEKRPFDPNTTNREEFLSRTGNAIPSRETIEDIYEAAKHGKLFVTSRINQPAQCKQCQIYVNGTNKAEIGTDIDHYTQLEVDATKLFVKPEKPVKPGFLNSFLAFFGNKNAKNNIAKYNTALEKYNTDVKLWDKQEKIAKNMPEFYEKMQNKVQAYQSYFMSMDYAYAHSQNSILFKELNDEKKARDVNEMKNARDMEKLKAKTFMNDLKLLDLKGELIKDGKMTPDGINAIAGLGYMTKSLKDINKQIFKNGDIHQEFGKDLEQKVSEYSKSQEFKDICGNLTENQIKMMISSDNLSYAQDVLQTALEDALEEKAANKQLQENKLEQNVQKEENVKGKDEPAINVPGGSGAPAI